MVDAPDTSDGQDAPDDVQDESQEEVIAPPVTITDPDTDALQDPAAGSDADADDSDDEPASDADADADELASDDTPEADDGDDVSAEAPTEPVVELTKYEQALARGYEGTLPDQTPQRR